MSYCHLVLSQRTQIESLNQLGYSIRKIAKLVKRHPSTIARELKRNLGHQSYDGDQASKLARERRCLASQVVKKMNQSLIDLIDRYLKNRWSPEQISGYLKRHRISISHSRIYQYIWEDRKQGGDLYKYLRHRGKKYKYKGKGGSGRGMIINRVDITLRPKIVDRKTRIGDWEADTIIGKAHQGAIVSLVDRKTKFTKLIKVKDKTAASVTSAVISSLLSLPMTHRTITFDNGKEFAFHEEIAKQTGAKTYFATPYHSWERGLNERTNGLVRQYIPKSTHFDTVNDELINRIENDLNNRPRKVLGFRSPNEVMQKHLRRLDVALQS